MHQPVPFCKAGLRSHSLRVRDSPISSAPSKAAAVAGADNLFHLVLPVEGVPSASQSSVGASAVNLHTEDPIPPIDLLQPRALTLLMLRPAAEQCRTALATLDECAAELLALPPALLESLCAPRFVHPVPDVFRIMASDDGRPQAQRPPANSLKRGAACTVPWNNTS